MEATNATKNDQKEAATVLHDESESLHSDSDECLEEVVADERDEVKEVKKSSLKDTRRVNVLRLATTFVLLLTALLVTLTTYRFLKNEETNNFETAVSLSFETIMFSWLR